MYHNVHTYDLYIYAYIGYIISEKHGKICKLEYIGLQVLLITM